MHEYFDQLVDLLRQGKFHEFVAGALELDDLTNSARGELSDTLLHAAIDIGHEAAVLWLIYHGAELDAMGEADYRPLHVAALRGNVVAMRELVTHGAAVDAVERDGNAPLHKACFAHQREAARILLDAGANPALANWAGQTPLDLLIEDRPIADMLISRGGRLGPRQRKAA